jgi:hypothetical protein
MMLLVRVFRNPTTRDGVHVDFAAGEAVPHQTARGRREAGKRSAHQCVTRRWPTEDKEIRCATPALSAHGTLGKVTKPKPKKHHKSGPLVVKSSPPARGSALPAGEKVDLTLAPKPRKKH